MGGIFHRWKLGFSKLSFTLRTGLAARHLPYLQIYPLYQHAIVPFAFRHEVSWSS